MTEGGNLNNNDEQWKLSPSDFKYLWEECKHCFWRKVHLREYRPSIFPSIFNKMSGMLQKNVLGTNPKNLVKDIPSGKFIMEEGFLNSKPLPSGKSFIYGRFDLLTKFDDGAYGVIDLKMIDAKDKDLEKFDRQLHAYKYALENPKDKDPIEIKKLGLLIVEPIDIKLNDEYVYYKTKPTWKEIEINMEKFYSFIEEVEQLLEGPEPPPQVNCSYCKYRYKI